MPIKRAALRQIRKDRKRSVRNQAIRSELKTLKKRVATLLAKRQADEVTLLVPLVMKRLDRAVAKGIIHRNTASRNKSRLMRRLAAVGAGTVRSPSAPAQAEGSAPSPA